MHRLRRTLLTALALAAASTSSAAADVVDWTSADASSETAAGLLHGAAVSLAGTDVHIGILDGSFTGFAQPAFSPALPTSDAVALGARAGAGYELRFASPVTNPVLHIASLASRLEFPVGTPLTKVSGQEAFAVSGAHVMGAAAGSGQNSDANGTVRLGGTYSTIRFTATPVAEAPNGDGFYLQVGVAARTGGGWGQGTVAADAEAEHQRRRLAALRAMTAANPSSTEKGPQIGGTTQVTPIGDVVEARTPWSELTPATAAALRNLAITPAVLESWHTGSPVYSALQARPWAELTAMQRRSAVLLGIQPANWDALAGVLRSAGSGAAASRQAGGATGVRSVAVKGNA